jgi:hypothetical protein
MHLPSLLVCATPHKTHEHDEGRAASFGVGYGSPTRNGRDGARQVGQEARAASQPSTQAPWNPCPHAGSTLTRSPSASSDRQMAHSASAHAPVVLAFPAAAELTPSAAPAASDGSLGARAVRRRARQRTRSRAAAWREKARMETQARMMRMVATLEKKARELAHAAAGGDGEEVTMAGVAAFIGGEAVWLARRVMALSSLPCDVLMYS